MATFIGTSGWNYPHWQEAFYPADLPSEEWLNYYAKRFASVEVNNTFYQLPEDATIDAWCDAVPADFRFAVKASRYITHMKKLKDPDQSIERFFDKAERFGKRLGPILFQLPPNWHANPDRLAAFLDALPSGHRYVFEFRDSSWWVDEITDILRAHNAAFCIFDLEGQTSPTWETADFVYLRLHGSDGAYQGSYSDDALRSWADSTDTWLSADKAVYCYFDNDTEAQAPQDAARLQDLMVSD